jgi:hypothetical protein
MEKVIKKRLNILDMLVKRLGEEAGKKAHDQILYGKNKKNNVEVPIKK